MPLGGTAGLYRLCMFSARFASCCFKLVTQASCLQKRENFVVCVFGFMVLGTDHTGARQVATAEFIAKISTAIVSMWPFRKKLHLLQSLCTQPLH